MNIIQDIKQKDIKQTISNIQEIEQNLIAAKMHIESKLDSEITSEDQKVREINANIVSDHSEVTD